MKKTNLLLAAAFSMALGSIAMNASACSTVVVGKDVSATGQIMIGHNEDNDLRIVTSQYWVPAADHKAGELITYEQTTAKIPQVAHTAGSQRPHLESSPPASPYGCRSGGAFRCNAL